MADEAPIRLSGPEQRLAELVELLAGDVRELLGRVGRLELAAAERRDAAGQADAEDDDGGAEGAPFKTGGPKENFPPNAVDEVEPDSKILKGGSSHPAGNAREDKSLDWAPGATSVMQLHDFGRSSNLEFEIPSAEDSGSGSGSGDGIQFAARVPKNGDLSAGAELKWYRLRAAGQACPPDYTLTEESGSGSGDDCVAKRFRFRKHTYHKGTSGNCEEDSGSGADAGTLIEIPPAPDKIQVSATGNTGSGQKAGTITVTPCGGQAQTLDVYNGGAGADGCTPAVAAASGTDSSGRRAAFTITPCGSGSSPITVYHGKDGADGCTPALSIGTVSTGAAGTNASASITGTCPNFSLNLTIPRGANGQDGADAIICGSFQAVAGERVDGGQLQYNLKTYTFVFDSQNNCWTLQAGSDNWQNAGLQIEACS